MTADRFRPTCQLRFVFRTLEDRTTNEILIRSTKARILQQRWVDELVDKWEWRDVPFVEEE